MKPNYEYEIINYVERYHNMLSDTYHNFCISYANFLELCDSNKDSKSRKSRNWTAYKPEELWNDKPKKPTKESIIEFLLNTSKKSKNTDIDFVNECNILLKSAGYSPLHERNPEDLLVKFCLKNNMSYEEYSEKRITLDNALAKDISDTQYNEELFEYIRSNKTKKGTLSEEEILEFENFIKSDNSKIFSKTRLYIVRYFSQLTEERRREKEPTYTTRWIRDNIEPQIPSDSYENFHHYLKDNCKLWTTARNSTIKVLVDALFAKYKNQGLSNVSIYRIANDFEEFYFSHKEYDMITKVKSRENKSDGTTNFKTDRLLANILKGKKRLTRTSLIQWLLFCDLNIYDIDDYLEQAQFFPITGYEEKDALSNMISFLFNIKNNYHINISELLIKTYETQMCNPKTSKFRFPLVEVNSQK